MPSTVNDTGTAAYICADPVPEMETELARLTRWRNENIELIGTPIFEQTTILHRQLTDLIARRL